MTLWVTEGFCKTEVDELNFCSLRIATKEEVVGFNVSVYNSFQVDRLDAAYLLTTRNGKSRQK